VTLRVKESCKRKRKRKRNKEKLNMFLWSISFLLFEQSQMLEKNQATQVLFKH